MSSELTPNQRLLLWHLGLRGGKALQMEVEYKEIAKDRKDLERRGLLTVSKERRSLALELKDGGWNELTSWANPPAGRLPAEVGPQADFAVFQALAAPCLEIGLADAAAVGEGTWRVRAGLANTGWLPTTVTERARANNLVLPLVAELILPTSAEMLDPPARRELGQLGGRRSFELNGGERNDGTPDRVLTAWTVRAPTGTEVVIEARHQRAGTARATIRLG